MALNPRYRIESAHSTGSSGFQGLDCTCDTAPHLATVAQALATLIQTPVVTIDVTTAARIVYTPAGAGSALSNATGFAALP